MSDPLDGARWRVDQGDCLELLRGLPDGRGAAIVTDPPYGLDFRGSEWDDHIPDWLPGARRVSGVVVFTTDPTTMWDYPRPDWVCCWYREAANSRSVIGGFAHWSPVLVYGHPKFRVDSIKLHAIRHAERRGFEHPTPKPLALMRWLVEASCPEGGMVCDPFCGSGSTGVACLSLGRRFLGIELSSEYAARARRRLEFAEQGLNAPPPESTEVLGGLFATPP